MTSEGCKKAFRDFLNRGEKDRAFAIYSGNPPQELLDELETIKEPEKKKSKRSK